MVFETRKLTLNVEKVDLMVNLISAKHKCGTGPDPHPAPGLKTRCLRSMNHDNVLM